MNSNDIIDLSSKEWKTLYAAISAILVPIDGSEMDIYVNTPVKRACLDVGRLKRVEGLEESKSLYHVTRDLQMPGIDFFFGGWFPFDAPQTFCTLFMNIDGSLYYSGESKLASSVMEIAEEDWTVIGQHPVAAVTTYYQFMAFILFFAGPDLVVLSELNAVFEAHGLMAEPPSKESDSQELDETDTEHDETLQPIPLTNLERLQQVAADLVDQSADVVKEQSRTAKAVFAVGAVGLAAVAVWRVYRALRS